MDESSAAEESLLELVFAMRARLAAGESTIVLRVLDPDLGRGRYPGERIEHAGRVYVHRPFRVWVDLAERLGLRLLTPRPVGDGILELHFEALDRSASWQLDPVEDPTAKYGIDSGYSRISKLEDPELVLDVADALDRIAPQPGARILDIGVNTGDEFELIGALRPALRETADFVGIDHSRSALELARRRFGAANYRFIEADVNALAELDLGVFDLIVSMATLQSPGVDDRALLRHLVQARLKPSGAVMLGIPNCRYVDGELLHGARMRNYSQPDLSLVIKDVAFFKRYLQQHRKRVFVTGKRYVLVTAV
jgi:SAM-dependent methyltransferase